MKKTSAFLLGIPIGALNILLGAGGGMIAVPALKKCGLNQKQAQANAVAVILPLTIISLIIYTKKEYVNFFDTTSDYILLGETEDDEIDRAVRKIDEAIEMLLEKKAELLEQKNKK